ncbi:hypothetical protein [Legionella impletisoli]|uniref:Uncharacterized protein n=1 Tax=Legionella impletisoli TaxID=343510 RepID=A0A917N9V7_9GAMM|nr:hypothetical protein [Legionella impletisoli]GGI76178.1 hypothetical protein GCM10007966_01270 [Legionella impletisoli]
MGNVPLPENMTESQEQIAKKQQAELEALFKALDKKMQAKYQESQTRTKERKADLDINEEEVNKLWDEVHEHTKRLIERGMQGFDSWTAVMSQILVSCRKLNEAIASLKLTQKGWASFKSWCDERKHLKNLQTVHRHKGELGELRKLADNHGVQPEPDSEQPEEEQSTSPKP